MFRDKKNTRATIRGLKLLVRDLEYEMKDPNYHHFKIEHTAHISPINLSYSTAHEQFELSVMFELPDREGSHTWITYKYLRSHKNSRWYRCNNDNKKTGKSLTLRDKID
jgi:hypothetical protein